MPGRFRPNAIAKRIDAAVRARRDSLRRDRVPDPSHPHLRRFTRRYRRKRDLVKWVWIFAGLLMLLSKSLALTFFVALGTTFLSFCLLDETA
jgi:hypothetical protein